MNWKPLKDLPAEICQWSGHIGPFALYTGMARTVGAIAASVAIGFVRPDIIYNLTIGVVVGPRTYGLPLPRVSWERINLR